MKATFEFTVPEEQYEFTCCSRAVELQAALNDLDQWLRSEIKYPKEQVDSVTLDAYQRVRDELWSILNDRGVVELF